MARSSARKAAAPTPTSTPSSEALATRLEAEASEPITTLALPADPQGTVPAEADTFERLPEISDWISVGTSADAVSNYLDTQSGRYIKGLEMLIDRMIALHKYDSAHMVLVTLLKMSKLGHTKIDLATKPGLRDELNLSELSTEQLLELKRRVEKKEKS